jgi:hypothetical protein
MVAFFNAPQSRFCAEHWTFVEDLRLRSLRAEGLSNTQIGALMGRNGDQVRKRSDRLGLVDSSIVVYWTAERLAILKEKAAEGWSFQKISDYLGNTTKNACIGKARRMGYAQTPSAATVERLTRMRSGRPKPSAGDRAFGGIGSGIGRSVKDRAPAPTPAPPPEPHVPQNPVSLLDRRHDQCSFIVSEDGAFPALMCGDTVTGGGSWCVHHRILVYAPRNPLPMPYAMVKVA